MTKPDSLYARVLKGKYFHNGDFMTARNKRNASHTWRALLFGREALRHGLIKRIGDGSQTRIWEDPWILAISNYRPLARINFNPETSVTMVQDQGVWDIDQLLSPFLNIRCLSNFFFPSVSRHVLV